MPKPSSLAALWLALALSGCASSPDTRFFTLDEVGPAAAVPASSRAVIPLQLDRIAIPAELDRPQIVRRTGADQLDIAGTDRWAGPLDDILNRVLREDLAARLPPGSLIVAGEASPQAVRHVTVDIDRFEGDLAGHVVLAVRWAVASGDLSGQRRTDRIELDATSPDLPNVVAAMSRAVSVLSDHIAQSVTAR